MSPKWLTTLVRARQVQEDAAKQDHASAQRHAHSARARVTRENDRIDELADLDAELTSSAFVAAAVALQSAAATHSAAVFGAVQADLATQNRLDSLRDAARTRSAAEQLHERIDVAERHHAALIAQRELDETGARVHRDAMREIS